MAHIDMDKNRVKFYVYSHLCFMSSGSVMPFYSSVLCCGFVLPCFVLQICEQIPVVAYKAFCISLECRTCVY